MSNYVWVLLSETFGSIQKSEHFVFKDRDTAFDVLDSKLDEYQKSGKAVRNRRNSNNSCWMIGEDTIISCYPALEIHS